LQLLQRYNHLTAAVASARKLSTEIKQLLSQDLKRRTHANEVEFIERIEPELIGGLVVTTPGAEMDSSVRTKLERLRQI
jgi:F0F1-type ATP synthase delta subunit